MQITRWIGSALVSVSLAVAIIIGFPNVATSGDVGEGKMPAVQATGVKQKSTENGKGVEEALSIDSVTTTRWGELVTAVDKWHWRVEITAETQELEATTVPSADEFVEIDVLPLFKERHRPRYPELAKETGIEGSVWVKALVDPTGRVREVMVNKASDQEVGFEEAALESAVNTVFEPALFEGKPAMIWLNWEVRFLLKEAE